MLMRVKNKDEKIQQDYFLWLCETVGITRSRPTHTYIELAWSLHKTIFYGFVPNDDNRAEDGKKLREKFSDFALDAKDCPCLDGQCTVLEMLVALSQRMEFILSKPGEHNHTGKYFWKMIDNLGIDKFTDDDPELERKIFNNSRIIDRWLERKFLPSGLGSIFPLKQPEEDQRNVEIWYQLMAWLDENYSF
jgi:hypothetical protein